MTTPEDSEVPAPAKDASAIEKADAIITQEAAEYRDNPLVRALGTLGELADQPPLITICAATLGAGLLTGRPRLAAAGARMVSAHLVATGMKAIVKRSVDRTRPSLLVDENRYESGPGEHNEGDYNSFPSGHTAGAVAVARAVSRAYPQATLPAGLIAAAVALVQIPRCKHYLSDITVGAVIGWIGEAAASELIRAGRQRLI